jgi:IclR family transcriptional regulator, KDG regulon repressor
VLTGRYLSNLDLVRVGRPVLRDLVLDINEDTELAIMKGDEILFLYKEECSQPLKFSIAIGERAPIYATSAGKAILAFLPGDQVSRYLSSTRLDPITRSTITDVESLKHELADIRSQGLAYGREEFHQGISAMASPVFDFNGNVVGSAVVTLPTIRFNTEQKRAIETKLLKAAAEISRQLGFDREIVGAGNDRGGNATRASVYILKQ